MNKRSFTPPSMNPDLTVAAIVESGGKFLMVEEHTSTGPKINQPSGHVGADESLLIAATREALEESAYDIELLHLIGIYQWQCPRKGGCLRIAMSGHVVGHHPERALDEGIVHVVWMTPDEIRVTTARHRSPMVLQAVEDYLAKKLYPLEIISHDNDNNEQQ